MVSTINADNTFLSQNLQDLIEYRQQGIFSKVLVKDNNSQYNLFCLAKGTEIEEHTSTRNAAITVVEGQGILTLDRKNIALTPGVFVFMPANAPHAIQAQENLAFMLVLSEHSHSKTEVTEEKISHPSQKTINIVKSTAPIIKQHGKQITTRMYEIMFTNHPEIREQFDMSAQADGSQPVKLANAVYSYATKIDNLEALKSLVEKIAYRHVKTHVRPEQYSIVGECLLQAIKDVLGDSVTTEVMAAWREAYQVLAEVFINREEQIYSTSQEQ